MTRFWWVRHGPTHIPRMVGWSDHPAHLDDTAALDRLRAHLPDAPVISSDLLRARQTADAICGARQRLRDSAGLREFHYGAWEDQPFDAIDSPELRSFFDTPGAQAAPDGESWNDVSDRVNACALALAAEHAEIILVAHMGVILTQWARATGLPAFETLAQKIDNLSVTRIDLIDGTFLPVTANHKP